MADEIVQVLGFDVDDAVANLDRLGNAVSRVSGRLTRFGKRLDQFNQQFGGSTSNLTQAGSATDRLGQSLERTERNVGRLTTSVELLSRIIYTQLVIKGLRLTEQALLDATKRAAELQVRLAAIKGVDDAGNFRDLADIGDSVRGLAKELGVPELVIATGLYEAIQNQIGGTKEELIDFNRVAGQFAVATLTSQSDSIQLLSGALNAYGLDVTRAEELASKFNKAIEVGAIEGSDLAHVFGRVSTRAAALGVTFEETLGLFETLTIRGINPNESATQIGALISAFTKPSEAMKAALEGLNVPSGEFLIRMRGIAGAMEAVTAQTDGSSAAVAKLFPNIRAVNGVVITASDNFDRLKQNIEATRNTALSLNKERFNIVFETDAKRVEREIENLRTEMTRIGEAILQATAETFKLVGGADNIVKAVKLATPVIEGYTAQVLLLKAESLLAANATGKLGGAVASLLGRLGPLAFVAGIAKAGAELGLNVLVDQSLSGVREIEQARKQALEGFKKDEQERLRVARDTDERIVRSALKAAQPQLDAFNATKNALILQEKAFVTSTQQTVNRVVKFRTDLIREVERAISDSARNIEQSQRRVVDLQFDKDQRRFEQNSRDLSDPDRVNRLLGRSRSLAQQAASDLSKAVNEEQISRALRLFDTSQRTAEEAKSISERIGKRELENGAVATLNRLTDQQITAEKRLQQSQEARATAKQKDLEEQRKITDEVKAQAKIIAENLATVSQTPQEAAKRQQIVREALGRLTQSALSGKEVSLADSLGLTRLAAEIQRNLGSEVKLNFDVNSTIEGLQSQMQQAFSRFRLTVSFDVSELERALGRDITTVDDIAAGFEEAKRQADELRASISKARQDQLAATTGARSQIRELLTASDSFINRAQRASSQAFSPFGDPTLTTQQLEEANRLVEAFRERATTLQSQEKITRKDVTDLFNILSQLQSVSKGAFKLDVGNFSEVVQIFNQIEQAGRLSTVEQENRLRALESVLQSADSAANKIEGSLTRGAERLERALQSQSVNPQPRAQNFATGGLARGTDTVSAMLTPGEVIMNRDASQRFYSDLQRMNAGMVPQYRNAGGPVTNVGDVSITVNESSSPRQTAAEIEALLLRRQRRGISRLK